MKSESGHEFYPPLEPFRDFRVAVGGGHVLHVEECGNPGGQPVLIVHGGPGGGTNPTMRRFHDPSHYRIVLFDQRGCGRSTPNASLHENTTAHLISDMEAIRAHLGIDTWQLFGGSWGSTLSLAYAEQHPSRVSGLILRGIFLLTRAELQWFYQDGCGSIHPEAFAAFRSLIPPGEQGDLIGAYHKRLTCPNPQIRMQAARAWSTWEGTVLSVLPDTLRVKRFCADSYALAFARIESHYFTNGGFFPRDGELLLEAHRLNGIPGIVVHGRYDVVTPLESAWKLHQAWRSSQLRIVETAGHAMTEPGIVNELVCATRAFCTEHSPDDL